MRRIRGSRQPISRIMTTAKSKKCSGLLPMPLFYPTGGPFSRRDFRRQMAQRATIVAVIDIGHHIAIRQAISDDFGGREPIPISNKRGDTFRWPKVLTGS